MADLTLDVSDIGTIGDQIAIDIGLNKIDIHSIVDNSDQVIPSYLDRIYIGSAEHFIVILSVE